MERDYSPDLLVLSSQPSGINPSFFGWEEVQLVVSTTIVEDKDFHDWLKSLPINRRLRLACQVAKEVTRLNGVRSHLGSNIIDFATHPVVTRARLGSPIGIG